MEIIGRQRKTDVKKIALAVNELNYLPPRYPVKATTPLRASNRTELRLVQFPKSDVFQVVEMYELHYVCILFTCSF